VPPIEIGSGSYLRDKRNLHSGDFSVLCITLIFATEVTLAPHPRYV